MRLGVDRGGGVEGVVQAVCGRGTGHELGDPLGAGRGDGERVEVRLRHQLCRQEARGNVPARRGAHDRRPEAPRDEAWEAGGPGRAPVSGLTGEAGALSGGRAGRRAALVAEVPRLPGVALDEAESGRMGRQPRVGGGRSQVELGRAAMKRLTRGRDPAGIGMLGEEPRLLGVGAVGGVDHQPDPGPARRPGEPVEGERDVEPHRLALPVGEWARVAAAAGRGRHVAD